MELGYWDLKGFAEPIRWLIRYLKLEVKETNPKTPEDWFANTKVNLGLLFANLPYLIDGDFNLTESCAIPVYLIRKYGNPTEQLLGKDIQEEARVRMIDGVLGDIRLALMKVIFGPKNPAEARVAFEKELLVSSVIPTKANFLSNCLGDKDFLFGHLTYADFMLAYYTEFVSAFIFSLDLESPFYAHPNLVQHMKRVHSLPGVKDRYESSKSIAYAAAFYLPFKLLTAEEVEQRANKTTSTK